MSEGGSTPGHIDIGTWLDKGAGQTVEPMEETDPIDVLRTMYLLTPGDTTLIDKGKTDAPEGMVYFKCSATLLGRVIRTLEAQGCQPRGRT